MLDITAIVLTKDEKLHIRRCIENLSSICKAIYVIDCFSTDGTQEIARELGATVVEHKWPGNQAEQFNWALDNVKIETEWILRLDADEYLTPELIDELKTKLLSLNEDITGIIMKRRNIFMGKWLKRGIYPASFLRIFKYGHAICEHRIMDEHITLYDGLAIELDNDFVDENLNSLSWFCQKHINYALREAAESLDIEYGWSQKDDKDGLTNQAYKKRDLKHKYMQQPLFLRAFVYYIYRYIFRLGFTEGKEGFIYNFLQAWWYRTLVDAKIFEIKKACENNPQKIREYLRAHYGITF